MTSKIHEKEMTIVEARRRLTQLPEEFADGTSAITVTRRGKPVMPLMPFELYDALMETLEIVGDPQLMQELLVQELRAGIEEARNGRTSSWQNVKQKNGW